MNSKRLNLTLALLLLILQRPSDADDRWQNYLSNDWHRLGSDLNIKSALIAGGWITGMYLLSGYDEELNRSVKDLYVGNWQTYFNAIDHLGNVPYTLPVSVGLTGLTLLGNDTKFQDAAFTSTEALVTTGMIVVMMKYLIGRARPYEGHGAHYFSPFSGLNSFPSGHAATSFALVTPWLHYYPHPATYLLLLLPASTAIARMMLDRHWFTDVLTGSVLGYLVGTTLAKWHMDLAKRNELFLPVEKPQMLFSFSLRL